MSSPFTHVAEAMTMRPVERSTAMTDQVANADEGRRRKARAASMKRCRMRGMLSDPPFVTGLGARRSVLGVSVFSGLDARASELERATSAPFYFEGRGE